MVSLLPTLYLFSKEEHARLDAKRLDWSNDDFAFYDGWKEVVKDGEKIGVFNPMKLDSTKRRTWAETLGLTMDLVPRGRDDRTSLMGYTWDQRQIEFYGKRMARNIDFRCGAEKDNGLIPITIANPAIIYSFNNLLPNIDRNTKDYILSGLLSNIVLRKERKGHKLLHITKSPIVNQNARELAHLRTLDLLEENYQRVENGNVYPFYSIWFLDPKQVREYVLRDFESSRQTLDSLPNWTEPDNIAVAMLDKMRLERAMTFDVMRHEGRINSNDYHARMKELRSAKKQIQELEAKISELKKGNLSLSSFGDLKPNGDLVDALEKTREEIKYELQLLQARMLDKKQNGNGKRRDRSRWNGTRSRERAE